MQLYLEVLPENQRTIWSMLGPLTGMEFVLYGGTAIALHLAHRQSVDFDFFSSLPLDTDLLFARMPILKQAATFKVADNTLILGYAVGNGIGNDHDTGNNHEVGSNIVQLSFFGNISLGRVGNPVVDDDNGLFVASLDDLMTMKLAVILKRAEKKTISI
ncbi:MAG: nucleotidyl transferase AbiEii/AbiGii toxin family protein [Actinobacteria bacterium]|nr:nucleotidyl transferase AbiEii/AbiGii toxin family protein [Actinomycetota bacterium]